MFLIRNNFRFSYYPIIHYIIINYSFSLFALVGVSPTEMQQVKKRQLKNASGPKSF